MSSRSSYFAVALDFVCFDSRSLQVLVVEARDLVPVHGIGTNPYVPWAQPA